MMIEVRVRWVGHFLCGVTMGFLMSSAVAQAQTQAPIRPACDKHYEVIVPLREPRLDRMERWRVVLEHEDYDELPFSLVVDGAKGDVIVSGSLDYTPKGSGVSNRDLHILRYGEEEGVEKWSKIIHRAGDQIAGGMARLSDGFVVAATEVVSGQGDALLLIFAGADGHKKFDRVVAAPEGDVEVTSVIALNEGGHFLVSVWVKPHGDVKRAYAKIYKFDSKGRDVWQRAYRPGAVTKIVGLDYHSKDQLIWASGSIRMDDGRQAGLLLQLGQRGEILAEDVFPRGDALILRSVDGDRQRGYVVAGDSKPYAKKDRHAGFVMKMGIGGDIQWQRFFAGRYLFYGRDVEMLDDGRTLLLLDGAPVSEYESGHIRFLTLSKRGYLIDDESFAEASDLRVRHFVRDDTGRRYVTGSMQRIFTEFDKSEGMGAQDFRDSFILALPTVESYNDACEDEGAFDKFLP